MEEELNKLRVKIDSIDKQLLELIIERADIVKNIASIKDSKGVDILRPGREVDLLDDLFKKNNEFLDGSSIINIWREIISTITNSVQSTFEILIVDSLDSDLGIEVRNYYGAKTKKIFNCSEGDVLKKITESKKYLAILPANGDWWKKKLPLDINIFGALPIVNEKPLGFLLGQVNNEKARRNKTVIAYDKKNKEMINKKYRIEALDSNDLIEFGVIEGYFQSFEDFNISVLGSYGYINP